MYITIKNIESFPHKIEISGSTYFIVKDKSDYYLIDIGVPELDTFKGNET